MRVIKEQIDRWAIRAAARSLPCLPADPAQCAEVERLLSRPALFVPPELTPDIRLALNGDFQFESSVKTPFPNNNVVHGRFFPATSEWRRHPSVLVVHGWNAELHYTGVLPSVAERMNKKGLNAILMELPFHMRRRPPKGEAMTNFISENIPRMLEATIQSIADCNAILRWVKSEGSPGTALWGFSLGGWLAGLHVCHSAAQDVAVLTTPVSNLERAVRELEFCHPIREALKVTAVRLDCLNLTTYQPAIPPDRVLFVEAKYDRFVPSETYAELAAAWNVRTWQSVSQSHITILVSRRAMRDIIDWLATKLVSP